MRPKIAVITTIYRPNSHTDVIVSRWLEPLLSDAKYGWPVGGADEPRTQIASLYIAQFHVEGRNVDIGREKAAQHDVPLYDTIAEALCLGTGELAVDGILLIGEHGVFERNEWEQVLYPRREMFDQIVEVFRASGRSVPVFNDKAFSYDLDSALHMVSTAREMGFPLMAGSSIPLAGPLDEWAMPDGADLGQALALVHRTADVSSYHSIEWLQLLVSRRAGGEAGIESVTAYMGEGFERAFVDKKWSHPLMMETLKRASKTPIERYQNAMLHVDYERKPLPLPGAVVFQHLDGLQSTYLVFEEQRSEFVSAVVEHDGTMHSARSVLSALKSEEFNPHFACLCARVEDFFLTGHPFLPVEYSLLTTLMTRAAARAMVNSNQTIETPELHIAYQLD